MGMMDERTKIFRESLESLGRDQLLELVELQDPELRAQVHRAEWVFEEKLQHLSWSDGTPILGRPLTNRELAMLIDEPFNVNPELSKIGLSIVEQRQLHIANDTVLWGKEFLGAEPHIFQILILRDPSLKKVLRAGRRLGKTWSMGLLALHYAYTTNNGRVIVLTPMKTQGALIYEQILKFIEDSPTVGQSITRNVASPQYEINLSNGATIRFFSTGMKSGGKCLTPDHDVLVRDGWKPIADVAPGEEIASYDSGQMIWSKVSHSWAYDHDDELVTHHGKQLSFSVTPNHKFLAKTRYPDSEYRFVEAENLKDYAIPTTGLPFTREGEWFSGDELELWGWWLSEGSGYIGKMARFSQVKEYGRARMVELAQKLGLHYTTPAREVRIEWRPPIECGMTAYNKFIPRLLMEEKEAPRLLEGLLAGDGYMRRNGWEYSSSSYALANDVQELGVRLGFRANIREKKLTYVPVGGGANNPHWVVGAYPREEAFVSKPLLKREKYSGKVHCVTVEETGVFLTRHNGLVHITGNSDVTRGQEAHVIILDELDYMGDDDLEAVLAMMTKTAKNQKPKQMIGASTPTGRHSTFWRWCTDTKSQFREFWFPSYCFPAGTMITMADGSLKPIEQVGVGDMVFSHDGSVQRVTKLFERNYSGKMVKLTATGDNTGLVATAEHPIWASRPKSQRARDRNHDLKWTKAGDISADHWLMQFYDRTAVPFKIDMMQLNNEFEEFDLDRVRRTSKSNRPCKNSMPRWLSSDNMALATVLGWYLAEGGVESNGTVGWTLHSKETQYVEDIQVALRELGAGEAHVSDRSYGDCVYLRITNTPLQELLVSLAGVGSRNKMLSAEIMQAPVDFQRRMLTAYLHGDGHLVDGGIIASTSSDVLARQLKTLGARLCDSIPVRHRSMNPGGPSNRVNTNPINNVMLAQKRNLGIERRVEADCGDMIICDSRIGPDQFAYSKVRKVDSYEDQLTVYNFEVEETNSYIAEGIVVHNCNPEWDAETEDFFREEYTEMGYRHEIEADWGEDVDGVFPRKYVDMAFSGNEWDYELNRVNQDTFYVMGVDWDKYGAGTNIVCLEVFPRDHANAAMRGKYRVCYREETKKDEYLLLKAMDRIIQLHERFHFRHIYIDRGYGEVQVEYLHKYGQEHPETGLYEIIKGVSFAESIEVRDPYHLQKIKKEVKPYMVDNLRQFFEKQLIMAPEHDEELYMQIISYVVARQTQLGRPVFESKDRAGDHALDALMLACLAITQNYGELLRMNIATDAFPVSNVNFLPTKELEGDPAQRQRQEEKLVETYGSMTSAPVRIKRSMTASPSRSGGIKRGRF